MSDGSADADEKMVRSIAAGDEAALARAYDAYGGLVYGLALRILGNATEAEDVAQEAFVRLWRNAPQFAGSRGSLVAWLATIARHRAVDVLRARRGQPATSSQVEPAAFATPAAGPAEGAEAKDARSLATAAVADLPPEERRVIELAYYEGCSQSQIAERTGMPLGTVKGRARNALTRLRRILPRSLGGER